MRSEDADRAVQHVIDARGRIPRERALLVAITGIDGAGKGYVTRRLQEALAPTGLRAGMIGIDGWLELPHVRFGTDRPAAHFYRHALRFDALFETLVLPLRERRSIRLEADFTEETATEYRRHLWEYRDLDVILLEGIFLLKRELRRHHDLALWIDCTFTTALERAVARAQEGLSADATAAAYRRIYFPAQQIHVERDRPREAAQLVIANDPRLAADPTAS